MVWPKHLEIASIHLETFLQRKRLELVMLVHEPVHNSALSPWPGFQESTDTAVLVPGDCCSHAVLFVHFHAASL